jgi:hypothetical protein
MQDGAPVVRNTVSIRRIEQNDQRYPIVPASIFFQLSRGASAEDVNVSG